MYVVVLKVRECDSGEQEVLGVFWRPADTGSYVNTRVLPSCLPFAACQDTIVPEHNFLSCIIFGALFHNDIHWLL